MAMIARAAFGLCSASSLTPKPPVRRYMRGGGSRGGRCAGVSASPPPPRRPPPTPPPAAAAPSPPLFRRSATLAVRAQGSSFSVDPPAELLEPLTPDVEDFDEEDMPDPEATAAVARELQAWLQQQHAALARVAGEVESFSASSWELHRRFAPELCTLAPLGLADFVALLHPERLSHVELRLEDPEPLPGGALRALRPFPRLRELDVRWKEPIDPFSHSTSLWSWDYGQLYNDFLRVRCQHAASCLPACVGGGLVAYSWTSAT